MTSMPHTSLVKGLLLLCLPAAMAAGGNLPLGDRDFYPTPERPVGFRGDGNGYFPGATLVTEFWEGDPKQVTVDYKDQHGRDKKAQTREITSAETKNIIWQTKLPAWANTQPVVVGDKVFTTGEPNRLICVDARTGKVLWERRANPWLIAGVPAEQAETCQRLFDIANEALLGFGTGRATVSRLVMPDELQSYYDAFLPKGLPRILAALKQADPDKDWDAVGEKYVAGLKRYLSVLSERHAAGTLNMSKGLDHDKPREMNALDDAIKNRVVRELGKIPGGGKDDGPMFGTPWQNMVGLATAVPISDGERIYASFGQGQTVCYDLDGKQIWASYREQEINGSRMSHAQSLRLADGVVVDTHGGTKTLAGLDAKTGELLWEAPTLGDFEFGKKGGYYVANHAVMPLKNGDKIEHVLITQRNNIIRMRDGKVLGPLPYTHGSSGGPSLVCDGDIVFRVICGDNTRSPLAAFQLSLLGDTLTVKKLWETPKDVEVGYQARVAIPGFYLQGTKRDGVIWNSKTGESTAEGFGGLSDLVIGNVWLWSSDNNSNDPFASSWGSRRKLDGRALAVFSAADISTPTAPKQLDGRMILVDERGDFANKPVAQELVPELYALPNYGYHSWGHPMHSVQVDSCMYPQGNFLFIRTVGWLYCIGPEGAQWHTPQGAPASARTGNK